MRILKKTANDRPGNSKTNRKRPGLTSTGRKIHQQEGLSSAWTRSAIYKWILGLLLVAILTVLAPEHRIFQPIGLPREGDISKTDVIAPFTFFVMKDPAQLMEEKRVAAAEVLPLFDHQSPALQDQQEKTRNILEQLIKNGQPGQSKEGQQELPGSGGLSEETLRLLRDPQRAEVVLSEMKRLTEALLSLGILPGDSLLTNLPRSPIRVRHGDVEYQINPKELLTEDRARASLLQGARARFKNDGPAIKAVYEIGLLFLQPNITYNQVETDKRKQEAMEAVPTNKEMVLKDEKIIDSHERVTKVHLEKLRSLALAKKERESLGRSWSLLFPIIGRMFFNVFVVVLLTAYLFFYRPKVFADHRLLLLLALIMIGQMVIAYLVRSVAGASEYLVPIAIAAMLTTIFFDAELGGVMALAVALLYGNLEGFDLATAMVALIVGTAAAYSVTKVRHRREFYRPMFFICLGYIFSIGFIGMMRLTSAATLIQNIGLAILSGVSTPILTSGILFIFEGLFHVTTDITLLELSDTNRPLLREMALKAPGTYHHSINVGYLAEAAAEGIGAHSLLARVASYYHDIGKLEKPEYFVENQRLGSKNPHDRLAPSMSSLILAAHIKDGVELAEQSNLPRPIIDVIQQHHGTSLMTYFYQKALDQGSGGEVEEGYRYPGPRPETKEAAIVMLADSVEAASRTLEEKTPSRLKGLVAKIIQDKFAAGELDDCELSLKDLHKIGQSFIHVLGGTFHQRVEYPRGESEHQIVERLVKHTARQNGYDRETRTAR